MSQNSESPKPVFPIQTLLNSIDAGAPLPPVEASDLKAIFELYQSLRPNSALGFNAVKASISAGSNMEAVSLRYMMLLPLLETGDLSPWQHGGELDDVVFQVAATFQLDRSLTVFPGYAIVEELRNRSSA
jgi:hypothetical protein